jgi:hypothetical protein
VNEVERLARLIAAEKMMLRKDTRGLNLPDDLWRQAIPQAMAELEATHGPEERPDWSHLQRS